MIANYGYRVGSQAANSPIQTVRDTLYVERFNLAFAGFGVATATWAAIFCLQSGLMPLTAIPVLLTARYGDRRLAGIAIAATAISASLFARLPNLEVGVWHTFLFAAALAGLYLLAEKNVVRAPKSDRISQFLLASRRASRRGAEIVLECDGLNGIASVYGSSARDHVIDLLRRSIRQETSESIATAQSAPGEFHLFLPNATEGYATQTAERIRVAFERYAFDAGYGAAVKLTANPASNS